MKKNTVVIIVLCMILLGLSGLIFQRGQTRSAYTENVLITAAPKEQGRQADLQTDQPENTAAGEFAVYVTGAVVRPGLYRYRGMSRVNDAIEAVGGFRKDAAIDSLNLARVLEDGEQIHVLTKKEALQKERAAEKTKQKNKKDNSSPGDASSEKVNINTADATELMTLPGIGEAKAALIINYREEHGNFSKIEDLMKISGIKEGIFQKIKHNITTS